MLLLIGGAIRPGDGLAAQNAATVPVHDPVYEDLSRLHALGLLSRGLADQHPFGAERIRTLLEDAVRRLAARRTDAAQGALEDADSLIARIRRRFGRAGRGSAEGRIEIEVGGGRSPGRSIPHNGVGQIDAVVNPLWAYRDGRAYGDRVTVASALGATLPMAEGWAAGIGVRASALRSSGALPGRRDGVLETGYVRVLVGPLAIQAGRDGAVWGGVEHAGLLLSRNAPPLDMLRISTDRPLGVGLLGTLELSVLGADLGPNQNFPHAKLFGFRVDVQPTPSLTFALSGLNKQMGEGAPEATMVRRLRDLTLLHGLIFGDDADRFSEKLVAFDMKLRVPAGRALDLRAGVALTDFDKDRVGDVLDAAAAYSASLTAPGLGAAGRHSLGLALHRIGPQMYRHGQFRSGLTVDGFLQGAALGPDGRRVALQYGYHPVAAGWALEISASWEARSGDAYERRLSPRPDVVRVADGPEEVRRAVTADFIRWLGGGRLRLDIRAGAEATRHVGFDEGAVATHGAILFGLRYTF